MTRELGDRMVADPRFKLLTFTGSPSVGWRMKERAGKKHVVLELGGNAGVIVDKTADLDWAVKRCLVGALLVRRPGLHQRPADVRPRGRLGRRSWPASSRASARSGWAIRSIPTTDLGPMVDATAAAPDAALGRRGGGARRRRPRSAARRDGAFFPPTVLTDVPVDRPGLLERGVRAARRRLPVPRPRRRDRGTSTTPCSASRPASSPTTWPAPGGRSPSSRSAASSSTTSRPTGSTTCRTAASRIPGLGREGLRWAIEDMTEIRIMVLAQPG